MLDRKKLFSRLAPIPYQCLIDATKMARSHHHAYVEAEHWIFCMLMRPESDFFLILQGSGLSVDKIIQDVENIIKKLTRKSGDIQDISSRLEGMVERGLIQSQMSDNYPKIRSSHILLGILSSQTSVGWLCRISNEFSLLQIPLIFEKWKEYTVNSQESMESPSVDDWDVSDSTASKGGKKNDVLDQWCVDFTELCSQGKLDPVLGRDKEISQVIDILLRRRQNNPILVGEAGVGKTAVVEGLAQLIVAKQVPEVLKNARLLSLDLGRIQAGAGIRGEFEKRLKSLIDAIIGSVQPIILFCDEAHTLIGAGGDAGTSDAVNLLKPALARGTLRMIAATTWAEYKQFFETDAALTRRFQTVLVKEPDEKSAIAMVRGVAEKFSQHHQIEILDDAIVAAVKLSTRHLPSRQLPDKAISLLDTACSRVCLSLQTKPRTISAKLSVIRDIDLETSFLSKELDFNSDAKDKILSLNDEKLKFLTELAYEDTRYENELRLSQFIIKNRSTIDGTENLETLGALSELRDLQSGQPLVNPWVDAQAVAEVVADWTGIPIGKMLQDDVENLLQLENSLNTYIFGQSSVISALSNSVRVSRAGLQSPEKPVGIYLLAGPTGTGKTETALALAEILYGGQHNLLTFNMTEFQEAHSISVLKGAPPGYVGYGKGGLLTEAVRRRPYSVILLDEFDKAHRDVHDLFYQVFDKGWMEDGEGRHISFRQCLILMTTNVGAEHIIAACESNIETSFASLQSVSREALGRKFSPALLARINILPYRPLNQSILQNIATKHLYKLGERLFQENKIKLELVEDVPGWIARKVDGNPNSGRAIDNLLSQFVLPHLSSQILNAKKSDVIISSVSLVVDENDQLNLEFN